MNLNGNTILITGGATGIGLALVEELLAHKNNRIIICGRRESRLLEVQAKYPEVIIKVCDATDAEQRKALAEWVGERYPDINVLINNAGIQNSIDFSGGADELESAESEIEVNLTAPVHLSGLFVPLLSGKPNAAIINISSGLAIVHSVKFPVYCATKAGIHVFSRCLREQLAPVGIKVFEALPPAVQSELNPTGRAEVPASNYMPADIYARSVIEGLESGTFEINNQYVEQLQDSSLRDVYAYFLDRSRPR